MKLKKLINKGVKILKRNAKCPTCGSKVVSFKHVSLPRLTNKFIS